MLEIRIAGRTPQGPEVACQILAAAFHRRGSCVQLFAVHGPDHPAAPVTATLRVDSAPITPRGAVTAADHLILLDPTLLGTRGHDRLGPDGVIVVNAPSAPCARQPDAFRVVAVDATSLAMRAGLGPEVATAMLGAFAGATGLLALDELLAAVAAGSPVMKAAHVAACTDGYRESRAQVGATA